MDICKMTEAYLECALWADLRDDDGDPLDDYAVTDICEKDRRTAREECAAFVTSAGELLADWWPEQAGHDFWLTRNGHGAGFWDRGKVHGRALTDIAHACGTRDIYLGDDGKVYII